MQHDMDASEWLNTPEPLRLSALRGRVVVVSAFQMLCRGCAEHSLPQAAKLHQAFAREDLVVIGLHSVFEHHAVMTPDALRAFVHEYRLGFPIAIDRPQSHSALPATMQAWGLRGTPSLMLFGRDGVLAYEHFGHLDDLRLGMVLGELLAHSAPKATAVAAAAADSPAPVCRIN